ncbi:hypothetical protein JCM6882_003001 [Rhodosporidiobolus microsporus]
MSTRTQHPRRASSSATYVDPPAYEQLESSEDEAEEGEVGWKGGSNGRTKGKAPKRMASGDDTASGDEEAKPNRRKRTAKKGKGKAGASGGRKSKVQGKLEVLKTLPVELLVEIFSHLNPGDLLALLRVNKSYRALLSAPASNSLWKNARQRFDLPDVKAAGGMTEIQYMHLVFGTECQHCGKKFKTADFFVRQRICNECRRDKFVRLDWLKRTHPDLHPLAGECVLPSYHSPAATKWTLANPYGSLGELEYFSALLWELQYKEDDAAATSSSEDDSSSSTTPPPTTAASTGRSTRTRASTSGRPNYAEESESEDEDLDQLRPSAAVLKLVKERKKLREALHWEGRELRVRASDAKSQLAKQLAAEKRVPWDQQMEMYKRANAIEDKVLDLDLGYNPRDFHGAWNSSKLVMSSEPFNDEVWEIKPQIIKLLDRIRRNTAKQDLVNTLQSRQKALRPRYDKLKAALPKSAQPFVPLFVDFLLLPSVKPL